MTHPTNATAPQAPPRKPPAPWPIDILNGAFRGDYCPNLGFSGYFTQGVCGFLPGIGTICAFRDLMAALGKKDRMGVFLNGFSLFPVAGGFPKTAHILRGAKNVTQIAGTGSNMQQHWQERQQ